MAACRRRECNPVSRIDDYRRVSGAVHWIIARRRIRRFGLAALCGGTTGRSQRYHRSVRLPFSTVDASGATLTTLTTIAAFSTIAAATLPSCATVPTAAATAATSHAAATVLTASASTSTCAAQRAASSAIPTSVPNVPTC